MELYFPIEINEEVVRYTRFLEWSNHDHQSDLLKYVLLIPDFMFLFKSNPIPPTPATPFTDLGYFRDRPQGQTVEVIIQASVIQSEVALEDYYISLASMSGEEVVQRRLINNNTDKPDMLLTKRFSDGETWVTRRTGYKVWMGENGAFVVTLNLACHLNYYYQNADLFYYSLSTFRPVFTPEYQLAERLKILTRRYPVDFATYLPMSWKEVHHHHDTMQEMKACFTKTLRNQIVGMLTVNAAKIQQYPNAETILWTYLKNYTDKGFDFNAIQTRKAQVFSKFHTVADSINFTYHQGGKSMQYNLTFYLAQNDNAWFYVEMFGLAKSQNFEAWAINRRAIQLLIENFKTI